MVLHRKTSRSQLVATTNIYLTHSSVAAMAALGVGLPHMLSYPNTKVEVIASIHDALLL